MMAAAKRISDGGWFWTPDESSNRRVSSGGARCAHENSPNALLSDRSCGHLFKPPIGLPSSAWAPMNRVHSSWDRLRSSQRGPPMQVGCLGVCDVARITFFQLCAKAYGPISRRQGIAGPHPSVEAPRAAPREVVMRRGVEHYLLVRRFSRRANILQSCTEQPMSGGDFRKSSCAASGNDARIYYRFGCRRSLDSRPRGCAWYSGLSGSDHFRSWFRGVLQGGSG